jgi:hypothetical protein
MVLLPLRPLIAVAHGGGLRGNQPKMPLTTMPARWNPTPKRKPAQIKFSQSQGVKEMSIMLSLQPSRTTPY